MIYPTSKITPLIFLSFIVGCSHTNAMNRGLAENTSLATKCEITTAEKEALLKMDYQTFDQTDDGWRKYNQQKCYELTRDLIDEFTEAHLATLIDWQKNALIWHSGQISGVLNDYPRAISQMEKTIRLEGELPDDYLWNPYVEATIAFLKKDKNRLLAERNKLAKVNSPFNQTNLKVVDSLIRCFDTEYKNAYSETCEP